MNNIAYKPTIIKKYHNGYQEISLLPYHNSERKLFIFDSITDESANAFVMKLMYLVKESDEPIYIYINSPGGEVAAGLMMYDALQYVKCPVYMICMGKACSMAAVIFASGKKGFRFMYPHAKTMIHEPLIAGGIGGSASSIHSISESIMETKRIVNEILAKHTKKTVEEIDKATAYDHFMTVDESVEFGICDGLVGGLEG